jgi:hypothetical protein
LARADLEIPAQCSRHLQDDSHELVQQAPLAVFTEMGCSAQQALHTRDDACRAVEWDLMRVELVHICASKRSNVSNSSRMI